MEQTRILVWIDDEPLSEETKKTIAGIDGMILKHVLSRQELAALIVELEQCDAMNQVVGFVADWMLDEDADYNPWDVAQDLGGRVGNSNLPLLIVSAAADRLTEFDMRRHLPSDKLRKPVFERPLLECLTRLGILKPTADSSLALTFQVDSEYAQLTAQEATVRLVHPEKTELDQIAHDVKTLFLGALYEYFDSAERELNYSFFVAKVRELAKDSVSYKRYREHINKVLKLLDEAGSSSDRELGFYIEGYHKAATSLLQLLNLARIRGNDEELSAQVFAVNTQWKDLLSFLEDRLLASEHSDLRAPEQLPGELIADIDEELRVLVVDDDAGKWGVRRLLNDYLRIHRFNFEFASTMDEAMAKIGEPFDAFLLDYDFGSAEYTGLDILKALRQMEVSAEIPIIMFSTHGETRGEASILVNCLKSGADDYVMKHPSQMVKLALSIRNHVKLYRERKFSIQVGKIAESIADKLASAASKIEEDFGLSGNCPSVIKARTLARTLILEPTADGLIFGETGAGKNYLMQALERSERAAGRPFIEVACNLIGGDPNMQRSEWFGHVKGAFSGAIRDKKGKFAEADGGTIFLDEIGELPIENQAYLLNVLDNKWFIPVGGEEKNKIRVRVRVVAATNRSLQEMVDKGLFRRDLFRRLGWIKIVLPPLRERREEIPLLVDQFVGRARTGSNGPCKRVSPEALRTLLKHDWPGNIGELSHCILRLVAVSRGNMIEQSDIQEFDMRCSSSLCDVCCATEGAPASTKEPTSQTSIGKAADKAVAGRQEVTREFQCELYKEYMHKARGIRAHAAKLAREHPTQFSRNFKKHTGMTPRDYWQSVGGSDAN